MTEVVFMVARGVQECSEIVQKIDGIGVFSSKVVAGDEGIRGQFVRGGTVAFGEGKAMYFLL